MRLTAMMAGLALALACMAGGSVAAQDGDVPLPASSDHPAVIEAKAFMASYRDELLAGDRAALADRYIHDGSFVVGGGENIYSSQAETTAFYAGPKWQPPEAFSWNSLSYEALSLDAVVVTGTFTWDPKGEAGPRTIAYTALLRRDDDGTLRIRLEHE